MATWAIIAANYEKKKNNLDKIITDSFKSVNLEKWAVEKITSRLYTKGQTGSLIKLKTDKGQPYYTPKYSDFKRKKGEITSHVTLKLDGGFYNRMNVIFQQHGFTINTEFKYLTVHFKNIYSSEKEGYADILSLTDDEIRDLLFNKVVPEILRRLHEPV